MQWNLFGSDITKRSQDITKEGKAGNIGGILFIPQAAVDYTRGCKEYGEY